jgi:hypothetical protein
MIFEFKLSAIEDVFLWGYPPNQSLSWFGFTDGKYRIKVGSEYLLNHSKEYTDYLNEKFPEYLSETTFIEYQVVRLWEDILEMLPSILEPVPKEIQYFFVSGDKDYVDLQSNLLDWQDSEIMKGVEETVTLDFGELAVCWLDDRRLNNQYLTNSAKIWIWSDEKDVIFSWDNREIEVENIPVWSSRQGNYTIDKKDFVNEVRKFNNNLISQMEDRVESICRNWNKPEIKIDFENLKNEQKTRANWLMLALNERRKTNWNEVISAIKIINQ